MIQQSLPFPELELVKERLNVAPADVALPWIMVAPNAPYFVTEYGQNWTPIGQNDSITWPEFKGVFLGKDLATAETYLQMLAQHGVTCVRLMLEYCQGEHRYFEKPVGRFMPSMIRLWDDLFALCEKHKIRILLTPYDTFWMWSRWNHHPYNKANGGLCEKRSQWLLCGDTREAIKQRLAFATERWGHSGALFAWDLWNEIHPAHADKSAACFREFIEDIGSFLRKTEIRLHGRAHPQTVSVFGPELQKDHTIRHSIFRHHVLDFSSVHFYESNTIDNPKNTVDAALAAGRLTREAIVETGNTRPFFDSEHGPIHTFKDKRRTLPDNFDNEYFLHMQWAHFASGGAGGGMRWPNRHPHSLTPGMRRAQKALADFLPLINWKNFHRSNLNEEIRLSNDSVKGFCCGDSEQAVLWVLRLNNLAKKGIMRRDSFSQPTRVTIPGLRPGQYLIIFWDTELGSAINDLRIKHEDAVGLSFQVPPFRTNLAMAIKRTGV